MAKKLIRLSAIMNIKFSMLENQLFAPTLKGVIDFLRTL